MSKRKLWIMVFVIILFLFTVGGTIAYFQWTSEQTPIALTVTNGTGSCTSISDNNELLVPTTSKENGRIVKLNARQEMADSAYITWNLVVNEINGLQDESFKYELVNATTEVSYGTGNFSDLTSVDGSNVITFRNKTEILDYMKDYEFVLYLWINGVDYSNPMKMSDQDFDFDLSCSITTTDKSLQDGVEAVTYITTLYENAEKTTVENNNINYNLASSVGLMNDRMGGTSSDIDVGNIRYYGADPDNYVYFNCENYNSPSEETCERWRILGVFNDVMDADGNSETRVKLVRADSLGYYSFDTSASSVNSGQGVNDWSQSDLMKLFNPGYEEQTINNSLYWNKDEGYCYTTKGNGYAECDFTSTGITDDTKDMVKSAIYYLGSFGEEELEIMNAGEYVEFMNRFHADEMYAFERSDDVYDCSTDDGACPRSTQWPGVVGLMYPSDYIYATDFSLCDADGLAFGWSDWNHSNLVNSNCYTKDYLHNDAGEIEWLISPHNTPRYRSFTIQNGKYIFGSYVWHGYRVRPTMYLKSDIMISGGKGTYDNPYLLSQPK